MTTRPLKSKPWFKEISIWISILALILSAITTGFNLSFQRNQDIRTKEDQLRQLIVNLIDLDTEFQEKVVPITNDNELYNIKSRNLSTKRAVYINSAEIIASQIPNNVTVSEYITLAGQRAFDANYKLAEEYFYKAIIVSNQLPENLSSILDKQQSLKNLAFFYYQEHPFKNLQKGKDYFTKAIELLEKNKDSKSIYLIGETYEVWGISNINNNLVVEGKDQLKKAKGYYSQLPPIASQSPKTLIENLERKEKLALRRLDLLKKTKGSVEPYQPYPIMPAVPDRNERSPNGQCAISDDQCRMSKE